MDFIQYYDNLPTKKDQKELRHSILKACKVSKDTFYKWTYRRIKTDEKSKLIIASLLDQPIELLFPQNK